MNVRTETPCFEGTQRWSLTKGRQEKELSCGSERQGDGAEVEKSLIAGYRNLKQAAPLSDFLLLCHLYPDSQPIAPLVYLLTRPHQGPGTGLLQTSYPRH